MLPNVSFDNNLMTMICETNKAILEIKSEESTYNPLLEIKSFKNFIKSFICHKFGDNNGTTYSIFAHKKK